MKLKMHDLRRAIQENGCISCRLGIPCDVCPNAHADEFAHALASLRLAYIAHQQSHWESRGASFYADHQMFQRMYETAQADTDALAEKIVGLFDWKAISVSAQLRSFTSCVGCVTTIDSQDHMMRAVLAEEHALDAIDDLYDVLEQSGESTLGLEDLLPQLASNRETNLYLLKQRLSEGKKPRKVKHAERKKSIDVQDDKR